MSVVILTIAIFLKGAPISPQQALFLAFIYLWALFADVFFENYIISLTHKNNAITACAEKDKVKK